MKRWLIIFICINLYPMIFAQVTAITEDGRKVYLYNDFTWSYYQDNQHNNKNDGIREITVFYDGMIRVEFGVKGCHIALFDGKLYYKNITNASFEYHNNSYFAKSVGKIKKANFGDLSIEFEYHQNTIFTKSEGKIKSIKMGKDEILFEYHEISFFEKSEGKLKSISKNGNAVTFEYFQNSIFPETEGKLKEISGEIPGIEIKFEESIH